MVHCSVHQMVRHSNNTVKKPAKPSVSKKTIKGAKKKITVKIKKVSGAGGATDASTPFNESELSGLVAAIAILPTVKPAANVIAITCTYSNTFQQAF